MGGGATLAQMAAHPLRLPTKTDAKAAATDLRQLTKADPFLADAISANAVLGDFLECVFALSPHLRDMAVGEPALAGWAVTADCPSALGAEIETARIAWKGSQPATSVSEPELMADLRRIKRRVSFLLALRDLARFADARETTRHLSALAQASLGAAIDHLLLALDDQGKLTLYDRAEPSERSGVIVLGMGKLGAEELNYSSDIDVVLFFDPDSGMLKDPLDGSDVFSKMVRRLIRILQERTAEGYVFRTDFRLRPDPGSTPLAIPLEAALNYYEGRGQNWERAAFIKARPIAGDLLAGAAFCRELTPFVFRKYLDYAAIADIHSIKRQIHTHRGFGDIAVKGHNVKLGRGGIREVEFFVQTQQLIAGGRMPRLRGRRTDAMLQELADARWIDAETATSLTEAYWFLRDIEHRIQMVRDEQSHTLPETDAELRRVAMMAGFADVEAFSRKFVATLKTVEKAYAELFEQEAHLSGEAGNLVFTGDGDDPDTLSTLSKLGFERPADIARIIRTWHYGRYRATQSAEARERLTELTPDLLRAFGATKRADDALLRFDSFIAGLPAGIQLFSLLGNNPGLLSLTVTIMAAAPRLADIVRHKPHVFDGMLDPALLAELPTRDYLRDRLDAFLAGDFAYEEILDRLRIVASEQRFLIGIRLLTGAISGTRAARAFSDLADLILETTLNAVRREVERAHGTMTGARVAIVGMGKLGSYELTAGSDIDMILIYDHDGNADESSGPKPLDPPRYFARLTQRLIAALSAPTAEGVLYEVDLRLRPSGNKGPVATRINAFAKYQREEAWTWEHMALSRARVVTGDESLGREIETVIAEVLALPRDATTIAKDVAEMRALIEQEKKPKNAWDFKLVPGGLIDIEFIAQYLALTAGAAATRKGERLTATADLVETLAPPVLGQDRTEMLLATLRLQSDLSQTIRLCLDVDFEPDGAPAGLIDLLCRAAQSPDLASLESELAERSGEVRRIFRDAVAPLSSRKSAKLTEA
jgi:glutamate-ammonia-ligase adenylyltransferase